MLCTGKKLYIETYGCEMNIVDSEIVSAILKKQGFDITKEYKEADLILINTCSIRAKAEQTIRNRLLVFNQQKIVKPDVVIGLLGCMAERLKTQLLEEEKIIDLIAGPDAYRDLPNLLKQIDQGQKAANTLLSKDETYDDIVPIRHLSYQVSTFISIIRGCNNMCSFCIVPFTRGRERSRDPYTIVAEAKQLFEEGYRDITLLGQNVDSYLWCPPHTNDKGQTVNFAKLLAMVAQVSPQLRIRFSSSHPKDITKEVLYTMKKYDNICKHVHLPAQSGNSRILKLMNRTYNREEYLEKIHDIIEILGPSCAISSDFIAGFCSETELEHHDTLSLIDQVQFDYSFMYYYSERPGTLAARKYADDVPEEVKKRRLSEIIEKQRMYSLQNNRKCLNKTYQVLIEKVSKRSPDFYQGRTEHNRIVILHKKNHKIGDYVNAYIKDCNAAVLFGET